MESRAPAGLLKVIGRSIGRPLAVTVTAVVAIFIIGLGVGGLLLWSEVRELRSDNSQLSSTLQGQISELEAQQQLSASLQDQLGHMKEEDQRLAALLMDQRDLAYTAAIPGISTVMLEGTDITPQSRGIFIISPSGTWGMLTVLSLEPLPEDKAYQIWLIGTETRASGGLFKVDETGYGQLRVRGRASHYRLLGFGCINRANSGKRCSYGGQGGGRVLYNVYPPLTPRCEFQGLCHKSKRGAVDVLLPFCYTGPGYLMVYSHDDSPRQESSQ